MPTRGYPIEKTLQVKMSDYGMNFHASIDESECRQMRMDNVHRNICTFTPEKIYVTIAIDDYKYDDGSHALCYLILNDKGQLVHTVTDNWSVIQE